MEWSGVEESKRKEAKLAMEKRLYNIEHGIVNEDLKADLEGAGGANNNPQEDEAGGGGGAGGGAVPPVKLSRVEELKLQRRAEKAAKAEAKAAKVLRRKQRNYDSSSSSGGSSDDSDEDEDSDNSSSSSVFESPRTIHDRVFNAMESGRDCRGLLKWVLPFLVHSPSAQRAIEPELGQRQILLVCEVSGVTKEEKREKRKRRRKNNQHFITLLLN